MKGCILLPPASFSIVLLILVPIISNAQSLEYSAILKNEPGTIVIGTSDSPPTDPIENRKLRGIGHTSDPAVRSMILRWVSPSGDVPDDIGNIQVAFCGNSVDCPAPLLDMQGVVNVDRHGEWKLQVLFLAGNHPEMSLDIARDYPTDAADVIAVSEVPFEVPINVIPESPIGLIALVVSSFAALGAYMKFRRKGLADT